MSASASERRNIVSQPAAFNGASGLPSFRASVETPACVDHAFNSASMTARSRGKASWIVAQIRRS